MILCLLVLAGCQRNGERKWTQGRNYDMHSAGDFDGQIPDGWRDVQDLEGPPFVKVPLNTMVLWPETFDDAEIVLGPVQPVSGDGCAGFVAGVNGNRTAASNIVVSNVRATTFGGDPGCTMSATKDDKTGWLLVRTHRDRAVFVRCLGSMRGLHEACDTVVTALKPLRSLDL